MLQSRTNICSASSEQMYFSLSLHTHTDLIPYFAVQLFPNLQISARVPLSTFPVRYTTLRQAYFLHSRRCNSTLKRPWSVNIAVNVNPGIFCFQSAAN
jgi:hypothetical protein